MEYSFRPLVQDQAGILQVIPARACLLALLLHVLQPPRQYMAWPASRVATNHYDSSLGSQPTIQYYKCPDYYHHHVGLGKRVSSSFLVVTRSA